jgi:hypothetical protein
LDKKGKPVIEKYTQSAMAYLEYVERSFAMGDTHIKSKFSLDFYQKLSNAQKETYYTSTNLSDSSVRRIKTSHNRRLEYDKRVNANFVSLTRNQQNEVADKLDKLQDKGERYRRIQDYEKLFKLSLTLQLEEEKFNKDCDDIKKRIENTPNAELDEDESIKKAQEELDELRVRYVKQHKLAENAKKSMEKQYNTQVRDWALEEFAQTHKAEFDLHKKLKDGLEKTVLLQDFFDVMCRNKDKAKSYKNELETYKVKHHVEENIEAETFCEVNDEEFKKFIEERNSKSKTGQLDPNSEIARCYFYAHCKRENPAKIDKFKTYFAKKINQKAKERVNNKTLLKHDKNIIKSKGAHKTAEMSSAPVSSSVAPATAGLTA